MTPKRDEPEDIEAELEVEDDLDEAEEEDEDDEDLDEDEELLHEAILSSGSRLGGGFFAGLVLGAVVGAGVALLLAPEPGTRLRRRIRGRLGELRERGEEGWDELREKTRKELAHRRRRRR